MLARHRVKGCDNRSRQHRQDAEKWRKRAIRLQIGIAVVSALAGSALLSNIEDSAAITVLALLTVLGAALTALGQAAAPARLADEHRQAAIRFSALGVAYNTLVEAWPGDKSGYDQFFTLDREHRIAEEQGPEPDAWKKAKPEGDSA
jgi:hypothetical protein